MSISYAFYQIAPLMYKLVSYTHVRKPYTLLCSQSNIRHSTLYIYEILNVHIHKNIKSCVCDIRSYINNLIT